jgi:hypothetical protein
VDLEQYLAENNLPVEYIPKGEQYEEAVAALEGLHCSAGIWYLVGKLGDRFSPTQQERTLTMEQAIEFLYRLGVRGASFHYPGEFSDEYADCLKTLLEERDMGAVSIGANTFGHLLFKFGGPASPDREAREAAFTLLLQAQEYGVKLGAKFQNNWAGRDGYNGSFICDPLQQWEWTRECYKKLLLAVEGRCGISIEFKPYDVPEQTVLKTAEDALQMAQEVEEEIAAMPGIDAAGYRHKIGVNIEDAHVYLSNRQVAEAVAKTIATDRLFLRHENDCAGRIDNDRIFGTIHFFDALEATYLQLTSDWDAKGGIHEPDIFPQRDDPLKAYIQSLNAILFYYALARRIREEIAGEPLGVFYQGRGEAEAHDRLLRIIAGGIDYRPIDLGLADRFRREMGI